MCLSGDFAADDKVGLVAEVIRGLLPLRDVPELSLLRSLPFSREEALILRLRCRRVAVSLLFSFEADIEDRLETRVPA